LPDGRYSDCLDTALLLRRDRYVAAIEPVQTLSGLFPMIARLTVPPGNREAPSFVEREELQAKAM
jgi:3-(3-hydroxy-phenyl)propionate hydroxylase